MKKIFFVLLVVLFVSAFFVMPAFAQGEAPPVAVTDAVQLYVIGLFASAILYALKIVMDRWPQIEVKREWLTVLLYGVSLILAVYWGGVAIPAFPAFTDPVTFVSAFFGFVSSLLVALAVPTSFATLIYNVLLKRVFDGLAIKAGWITLPDAASGTIAARKNK